MAAGGAHLVVFSTGRGTPTGNPIVPVIKITGNKYTFANMSDNIDLDVSALIYEPEVMQQQAERLFNEVVAVANGKMTKAELLGYTEIAIPRVCNYV
jgi:altronate dehydratase large subunit